MECNKEEAIRAKEIAEMKMQTGDFAGAKRMVQRAQQLFPELQNIPQMLMVCEVHCSAQTKVNGSEMDWYGILQVEQFSDDANIKKQYRRLALALHPDKNKFPGAEAAFKLIGEANRVLADPAKRSTYDMKCRGLLAATLPRPAPHHSSRNSQVTKQHGAPNIFSKVSYSQNTSSRPQQQPDLTTFWTCCSNCKMRFKYYKAFRNRKLRCQGCQQSFIAHDLGFEPPIPPRSQFINQKGVQNQGPTKVTAQSNFPQPSFASFPAGPIGLDGMGGKAGDVTGCSKAKESEAGNSSDMGGHSKTHQKIEKGVQIPKTDSTKHKESGNSKNSSKKKRKLEEESSESFVMGNTEEIMMDKDGDASAQGCGPTEGRQMRRSSRKRLNVFYNESLSDGDFISPLRSKYNKFPDVTKGIEQESNNGVLREDTSAAAEAGPVNGAKEVRHRVTLEDGSLNKKNRTEDGKAKEEEAPMFSDETMESNDVELKANFDIPDAEFNNFDNDRVEACFRTNQLWALYDSVDGMPRFYAYVEKVSSPAFKLRITWLEHSSNVGYEQKWDAAGLPRGCGKYKLGETEEDVNIQMFSHRMEFIRGKRGIHLIYPRKGEVWALFKLGVEPQKHGPFQFEFVEVVRDIDENMGIGVSYLRKVKGFLSIFRRAQFNGVISFCIRPEELFRFSHRIPAFRMTGNEGEGVPAGSFELDPASLPSDIDDVVDAFDVKDKENLESEIPGSCSKVSKSAESVEELCVLKKREDVPRFGKSQTEFHHASNNGNQVGRSQSVKDEDSQGTKPCNLRQPDSANTLPLDNGGIGTPGKRRSLLTEEDLKPSRSSRDLSKKNNSANVRQISMEKATDKHTTDTNEVKLGQSSASTSRADDKTLSHANGGIVIGLAKNFTARKVPAGSHTVVGVVRRHDFKREKSVDKFQLGQIWALFGNDDTPPRAYGQIKKITSTPDLKLQVAMLEVCSTSKDAARPLCCGTFKVNTVEHQVLPDSRFSHMLEAQPVGKNRYEIHPRRGEIWAVDKNWRSEPMTSDQDVGECDFVEVLEDNNQSVTVIVLERYKRYKQLYWCPGNERSKAGVRDIPRSEFARFSHPCSAFRHEGGQRLWELDIGSIPCPRPDVILLD